MKKGLKITLIVLGSVFGTFLLLFIALMLFSGDPDMPNPEPAPIDINDLKPDDVIELNYQNVYILISIADDDDVKDVEESAEAISGETNDGAKYVANADKIVVDKGGQKLKVTVAENEDSVSPAQIASVATKVASKVGYDKKNKDWNVNYGVYYIEAAECLVYYPKQLKLTEEREDLSLLFKDPRSSATLNVYLEENLWDSMEMVTNAMTFGPNNKCLAVGNDWYTREWYRKQGDTRFTVFQYVGLGKSFEVHADLKYENQYSFVFNDLRKLIKCTFINDGVWEPQFSTADGQKKVESVYVNPNDYDPVMTPTTYYVKEWECAIQYPDIFTRVAQDEDAVVFNDPKTGAGIFFTREEPGYDSLSEYISYSNFDDVDILNEHSLRGTFVYEGKKIIEYASLRDGYLYCANMFFELEYQYSYEDAFYVLQVLLPGENISNMEITDIYYPQFGANVTLPIQLNNYTETDGAFLFWDPFYSMDFDVSFWRTDLSDKNNIFEVFDVVGEDSNVYAGEDFVKWHNQEGAHIGVIGEDYCGIINIQGPNAYSIYKGIWDQMGIKFTKEIESFSDQAAEDMVARLEEELEAQMLWEDEPEEDDIYDEATAEEPKLTWITNDNLVAKDVISSAKKNNEPSDAELENQPTEEEKMENQPTVGKEDFDDSYDILLYWEESVFADLPFEESKIDKEKVVSGESNYFEYTDWISDEEFAAIMRWIEDDGFVNVTPSDISNDEYGTTEYYQGQAMDQKGEYHDITMILDYEQGYLYVSYFYMSAIGNAIPGSLCLDYPNLPVNWYSDSEFLYGMLWEMRRSMPAIKHWYGSRYMDEYLCITQIESDWTYKLMTSGYYMGGMVEPELYVDEYSFETLIEAGQTDGYYFYPEVQFYYFEVQGVLFELNQEGALECLDFY